MVSIRELEVPIVMNTGTVCKTNKHTTSDRVGEWMEEESAEKGGFTELGRSLMQGKLPDVYKNGPS